MNGRIYDPLLGRFLSADKVVQFPDDLQNYNRYSYVLNNPLTHTDPTGYEVTKDAVIPFSRLIENVQKWESMQSEKSADFARSSPSARLESFYGQIEDNAMFDKDTGATKPGNANTSELGWHYVHTSEGWVDMGHFSNAARYAEYGYIIKDAASSADTKNMSLGEKVVTKLLQNIPVETSIKIGGDVTEGIQFVRNLDPTAKNSTQTSAFTREDYHNNRLGAEFATFLRDNKGNYENLADALKDFLGKYSPSDDPKSTSAFGDLPEETQESLDSRSGPVKVGRSIKNMFKYGFKGFGGTVFSRSKPPEEEEEE